MPANTITGRAAFVELLKSEGITHLFGNPGTTELPIMHALTDHRDLTYVLGMQESLVVAMADGFSRASGQLVACNVHVAPGLGNAMGALYNAKFTGTPMIVTAGQQEQGHGLTEPLLYDPLVPIATPLVKWAVEVTRLEDLPMIVRRAAKVAMTPPTGPVFISLPGDILNAEAGIDLGTSSRITTRNRPTGDVIAQLAGRILRAANPVIIAGDELVKSDALVEAASLAGTLGCPVYQQSVPYGAHFLSEHPCFMGALTRSQPQVRKTLAPFDLMIVLGADPLRMSVYSEVSPLPDDLSIIHIGLNTWDMAKSYHVDTAIQADLKATLPALSDHLAADGGAALAARAEAGIRALEATNWTANRAALINVIEAKSTAMPIDPDWLTLELTRHQPPDTIFVNEALTSGWKLDALRPYRERHDYHGLASGGIGWGLPGSIGVSLAHPGRRVCCFSGDGSAMYSIQSLWTAAHHKLPITFVIANNGGYRIIKQRLKSFHGNEEYIGMDFANPPVDFTGLAASFGMAAHRIDDPALIADALTASATTDGPTLLEVVVDGSV